MTPTKRFELYIHRDSSLQWHLEVISEQKLMQTIPLGIADVRKLRQIGVKDKDEPKIQPKDDKIF